MRNSYRGLDLDGGGRGYGQHAGHHVRAIQRSRRSLGPFTYYQMLKQRPGSMWVRLREMCQRMVSPDE